ncbi:response regulator [Rhodoblastus acidophilus]|uniref:Response regulator n=1 Tax=Candidatus Rhodoblastus alkanivorans TaxID=2954117 RepID=A0ABS9Z7W6_9HYPH|nr:response regulator [Candidatus Rhodoblastus alkanivorans]MCI4678992.1 response regulator [Candidatus Rhodoblastus alkanivorans]MCI4683770.1 response regulator [Candidatus Rhodoblastus alkanivorans]MDI4641088.1 response regulator [Rhodoblastus acidophilus]
MAVSDETAGRKVDVLIIEDDHDDAYLLTRALKQVSRERGLRLDIRHSVNGLDAMGEVARKDMLNHLPNVVVVDLNMPVMDGGRFLKLLRSEMRLPGLRAVVLTTSTEKPVHDEARANGADMVFAKPSEQKELIVIARQILDFDADVAAV